MIPKGLAGMESEQLQAQMPFEQITIQIEIGHCGTELLQYP